MTQSFLWFSVFLSLVSYLFPSSFVFCVNTCLWSHDFFPHISSDLSYKGTHLTHSLWMPCKNLESNKAITACCQYLFMSKFCWLSDRDSKPLGESSCTVCFLYLLGCQCQSTKSYSDYSMLCIQTISCLRNYNVCGKCGYLPKWLSFKSDFVETMLYYQVSEYCVTHVVQLGIILFSIANIVILHWTQFINNG